MKLFLFSILIMLLFLPISVLAESAPTAQQYVADVYNRYSLNFDELGLVYAVPDYGVDSLKPATTARELMSLAIYYRFRAAALDTRAQKTIVTTVREVDNIFDQRSFFSYSFEDAAAQFLLWRTLDELPALFTPEEIAKYKQKIIARAEQSLAAPDTENRAVLAAAYWQYMVNEALKIDLIDVTEKIKLNDLIKNKLDKALIENVDGSAWYAEGRPKTFNPHYHLITAFYIMVYGELVGDERYIDLARRMAANLRQVSFENGMVEAALGPRPIGLGAQFYLGAGLLNWRTGFTDYGAYLKFAQGAQFFADPKFSNRLEYHATMVGREGDFHDDYAFSNLAEMALALDFFNNKSLELTNELKIANGDLGIFNDGRTIVYGDKKYVLSKDNASTYVADVVRPTPFSNKVPDNFLLTALYVQNGYQITRF